MTDTSTISDRREESALALDELRRAGDVLSRMVADCHGWRNLPEYTRERRMYEAAERTTEAVRIVSRVVTSPAWHAEHLIGVDCIGLPPEHVEALRRALTALGREAAE